MKKGWKIAKYIKLDGGILKVAYDPKAPCICCGLSVGSASMGGTVLCPACDCGYQRSSKCPPYGKPMPNYEFLSDPTLKE